jgi:hypothetical protein
MIYKVLFGQGGGGSLSSMALVLGLIASSCQVAHAATDSNNAGGNYYSFKNLEKALNQMDQSSDWKQTYRQIAPSPKTIQGPGGEARYAFSSPSTQDRSFHTFFPWRNSAAGPETAAPDSGYAVSGSAGTTGVATPQSNPFDLSPFGVLHYLWDPTTYTSSSNPVSLVEVRNDLQVAQQQSAMAESAAKRAKYASTPQERQAAAQQARYYAQAAQQAAQRAQAVAQGGSSNPSDVAALASEEADRAVNAARQASSNVRISHW